MLSTSLVSPFTPQNDIPLSVFLAICDQPKENPGASHDKEWHYEELAAYQHVLRLAYEKRSRDLKILEVGCGTGRIGPYLAALNHVCTYSGIDVVQEYLDYFKQHSPALTLCNQDIFKLEEDCRFDVILLPFTTLHLFTFPLQEVLITKLLRNHTSHACFDVMLPDWGGHTSRFTWEQTIQIDTFVAHKKSYALARKDYHTLAEKLGVRVQEHDYHIRSTDGRRIRHTLLTFWR